MIVSKDYLYKNKSTPDKILQSYELDLGFPDSSKDCAVIYTKTTNGEIIVDTVPVEYRTIRNGQMATVLKRPYDSNDRIAMWKKEIPNTKGDNNTIDYIVNSA